jgi:hypothetical protein
MLTPARTAKWRRSPAIVIPTMSAVSVGLGGGIGVMKSAATGMDIRIGRNPEAVL